MSSTCRCPRVGATVTAGDSFSEVESTKSVSDIYAPVSGTVVAVNDDLADEPETLNSDPYGAGWICEIELSDPAEVDALLDAVAIKLSSRVSLVDDGVCVLQPVRSPEPSGVGVLLVVRQRARSHRLTTRSRWPRSTRCRTHPAPTTTWSSASAISTAGVASLVVRTGPQAGAAFALHDRLTRLGRHPDSEISLDDITVSRRHAEVVRHREGYVVRDAGSLNGTYVNNERIDDEVTLQQGDELQVGKFRLVFFERADG